MISGFASTILMRVNFECRSTTVKSAFLLTALITVSPSRSTICALSSKNLRNFFNLYCPLAESWPLYGSNFRRIPMKKVKHLADDHITKILSDPIKVTQIIQKGIN